MNADTWTRRGSIDFERTDDISIFNRHGNCEFPVACKNFPVQSFEEDFLENSAWSRAHNKTRENLFTPLKVARGPESVNKVGKYRYTIIPIDGSDTTKVIVDRWKTCKNPNRRIGAFKGSTYFTDKDLSSFSAWYLRAPVRGGVTEE